MAGMVLGIIGTVLIVLGVVVVVVVMFSTAIFAFVGYSSLAGG